MDATVLIATYNRAAFLDQTLTSLAQMHVSPALEWDAIVVDNNSADDTRQVVERHIGQFPVRLAYLFAAQQGRSSALNAGIAQAQGAVLAFTDDDVRLAEGWLDAAATPLLGSDASLMYSGGPVRPIWGGPRPVWLDERGNLGGPIAVMDHGSRAFVFEDDHKTPLGVNMAVRRSLIERIGGFRPDLGRNGKALLGQEQAEFFYRSRQAGARGLYVPEMVLDHVVPASRLTRTYFRKWWYWKGVSHARVHAIHGRTELGIDTHRVPRLLGVPRFVFGNMLRNAVGWLRGWMPPNSAKRARHWLSVAYYAGYIREIWFPSKLGRDTAVQTTGRPSSSESPALL